MKKTASISRFKILEEANNLKRTKEAMAKELKIPLQLVKQVLNGKASDKDTYRIIQKMLKVYPLKEYDLNTATKEGFIPFNIFSSKLSQKSSRFFKRKNSLGISKTYYEYRDTAMSKLSPIYPEWIKPLVSVNNSNPRNKLVCYNKGHILHQFTFFIGKVNFYWKDDEGYHCAEMNTGDSNYIPPYISHSFTSRDKNNLGLIIAVTFGDILKFSREKFLYYKKSDLDNFIGLKKTKNTYLKTVIKNFLNMQFIDIGDFELLLSKEGLKRKQISSLINGTKKPNQSELQALSKILQVPYYLLDEICSNKTARVIINKFVKNNFRKINDDKKFFKIWDLARSDYKKELYSFLLEATYSSKNYKVLHELHEYVYNFSNETIYTKVNGKIKLLKPQDSAIFSPMVEHSFYTEKTNIKAQLLIIRVPDDFNANFFSMYSGLSISSKKKIFSETTQWF